MRIFLIEPNFRDLSSLVLASNHFSGSGLSFRVPSHTCRPVYNSAAIIRTTTYFFAILGEGEYVVVR